MGSGIVAAPTLFIGTSDSHESMSSIVWPSVALDWMPSVHARQYAVPTPGFKQSVVVLSTTSIRYMYVVVGTELDLFCGMTESVVRYALLSFFAMHCIHTYLLGV
jgi:hypothetical protein